VRGKSVFEAIVFVFFFFVAILAQVHVPHFIAVTMQSFKAGVMKLQRESTSSSLSTNASSTAAEYPAGHSTGASSAVAEYPAGLIVRNTFLDFQIQRPESLDGFLDERHIRSAPGSRLEDVCGTYCQAPQSSEASHATAAMQHHNLAPGTGRTNMLQLAELISEPQLGSDTLPTMGSRLHGSGGCKPCAFIWKEPGCENGINCPFCHLCDSGEKKRRAKEKKEKIRSIRGGANGLRQTMMGGINRLLS